MAEVGRLALWVALLASAAAIPMGLVAGRVHRPAASAGRPGSAPSTGTGIPPELSAGADGIAGSAAAWALGAGVGTAAVAVGVLGWALVTNDFSLTYVADFSRRDASGPYRLASLWGGMAGSLLWFATLVGAAGWWATRRVGDRSLRGRMVSVTGGLVATLVGLVLAFADPFQQLDIPALDGSGLTPILEHPAMLYHPPLLYLGLATLTGPFALTVAGLGGADRPGLDWQATVRRWLMVPWLLLAVGMLAGAHWAYVELGWGGYWAWDPVENTGLLPWLAVTLALHAHHLHGVDRREHDRRLGRTGHGHRPVGGEVDLRPVPPGHGRLFLEGEEHDRRTEVAEQDRLTGPVDRQRLTGVTDSRQRVGGGGAARGRGTSETGWPSRATLGPGPDTGFALLVCVAFLLALVGAMLTRSGAVSSVHAFAESRAIGRALGVLVGVAAIGVAIVLVRARARSGTRAPAATTTAAPLPGSTTGFGRASGILPLSPPGATTGSTTELGTASPPGPAGDVDTTNPLNATTESGSVRSPGPARAIGPASSSALVPRLGTVPMQADRRATQLPASAGLLQRPPVRWLLVGHLAVVGAVLGVAFTGTVAPLVTDLRGGDGIAIEGRYFASFAGPLATVGLALVALVPVARRLGESRRTHPWTTVSTTTRSFPLRTAALQRPADAPALASHGSHGSAALPASPGSAGNGGTVDGSDRLAAVGEAAAADGAHVTMSELTVAGAVGLLLAVVAGVAAGTGILVFAGGDVDAPRLVLAAAAGAALGTSVTAGVETIVHRSGTLGPDLAHAGIGLLLLGVAGTATGRTETVPVEPGDRVEMLGQTVEYHGVTVSGRTVAADVRAAGRSLAPSLVAHPARGVLLAETSLVSTPWRDVQVALRDADDDGSAVLQIGVHPLQVLVWWGGLVIVAAGLVTAVEHRSPTTARPGRARGGR